MIYFAALFCVALVISNIIAGKIWATPWGFIAPAGVILFPIVYILDDVIPEVYGWETARRIIWTGFALNLVAVIFFSITLVLPHPDFWTGQDAFSIVLGFTPRLLIASFCAYLVGSHSNAWIMVQMKKLTKAKLLWIRTIGSTIVGESLDSTIFITIAFFGVVPTETIPLLIVTQAGLKTLYETIATPLTYAAIAWAKRVEGVPDDVYVYHLTHADPTKI